MRNLFFLLLIGSASVFAQPALSVRVGAAIPDLFASHAGFMYAASIYWPVGFTGGLMVRQALDKWIDAALCVEHELYPFQDYSTVSDSQAGDEPRGGPAHITRLESYVRLMLQTGRNETRPFVRVGGGYTLERYSAIQARTDLGGALQEWSWPPEDYWSMMMGAGMSFRVGEEYSLETELLYRCRVREGRIPSTFTTYILSVRLSVDVIG
jgi:hypothetical protein